MSMILTILTIWVIDCGAYSLICAWAHIDFNIGIALLMLIAIAFALLIVNDASRE